MINHRTSPRRKTSLHVALLFPLVALIVPFIATQTSVNFNWSFFDIVLAGAMLMGTSLAFWGLVKKNAIKLYNAGVLLGISAYLLTIWANLAVGIVGHPEDPVNLIVYVFMFISACFLFTGRKCVKRQALAMLIPVVGFLFMASLAVYFGEPSAVQLICLALSGIFAFSNCSINFSVSRYK